jgi:hypothetical protein
MISRHPKNIVELLRLRDGHREQALTLDPAAIVPPGTNQGSPPTSYPNALPAATEIGDALVVAAGLAPAWVPQYADLEIVLDGSGATILTGVKMDVPVDFACEVVGWSMFCDAAVNARVDLWSDSFANFPPTIADTMPGADANKPRVVAAAKASGGVSGWTKTAIAAGDIIRVNLDTNDAAVRITVGVKLRRV